jgi:hypothetical protein
MREWRPKQKEKLQRLERAHEYDESEFETPSVSEPVVIRRIHAEHHEPPATAADYARTAPRDPVDEPSPSVSSTASITIRRSVNNRPEDIVVDEVFATNMHNYCEQSLPKMNEFLTDYFTCAVRAGMITPNEEQLATILDDTVNETDRVNLMYSLLYPAGYSVMKDIQMKERLYQIQVEIDKDARKKFGQPESTAQTIYINDWKKREWKQRVPPELLRVVV